MKHSETTTATDAELLDRYEKGRDQRAFAEVVRRHRPMVLATTRRVVRCRADADDACQAAFLTLARTVDKLTNKSAVASWLHRTAYRCAIEIRRTNLRWEEKADGLKGRTKRTVDNDSPDKHIANEELSAILDEELTRLPAKYHQAIVYCDLEGKTQKQAAKILGVAQQTVNDRLSKARRLLRDRLLKRGVTLTLAGLATCVAGTIKPASAATSATTEIASKATLYAAGGTTASEVGVSVSVLQTANSVIYAMTKAKIVAVSLAALAIVMFLGSMGGLVGSIQSAQAGTILFEDNFDDGLFADSWELSPINSGNLVAGAGKFVLGRTAETDPQFDVYADAPSVRLQDSSVRAKARVNAIGGSAILASRIVDRNDTQGYFAGVAFLPAFGGSILYAGKSLGGTQLEIFPPTGVDESK